MQVDASLTSLKNIEQFFQSPDITKKSVVIQENTQNTEDLRGSSIATSTTSNRVGKIALGVILIATGAYIGNQIGSYIVNKFFHNEITSHLTYPSYDATCSINSEPTCLGYASKSNTFSLFSPEDDKLLTLASSLFFNEAAGKSAVLNSARTNNPLSDYLNLANLFANIQSYCSQVIGRNTSHFVGPEQYTMDLFYENSSKTKGESASLIKKYVPKESWSNCMQITSKGFYKKIDEFCRNATESVFMGGNLLVDHICGCGELNGKRFFDFNRSVHANSMLLMKRNEV